MKKKTTETGQSSKTEANPTLGSEEAIAPWGNAAMAQDSNFGTDSEEGFGGLLGAAEGGILASDMDVAGLNSKINFLLSMIGVETGNAASHFGTYLQQVNELPWYHTMVRDTIATGVYTMARGGAMLMAAAAPEGAAAAALAAAFFGRLFGGALREGVTSSIDRINPPSGNEFTPDMKADFIADQITATNQGLLDAGREAFKTSDEEVLRDILVMLENYTKNLRAVHENVFQGLLKPWLLYGAEATQQRIPGFGMMPGEGFVVKIQFTVEGDPVEEVHCVAPDVGIEVQYAQVAALPEGLRDKVRSMTLEGVHVVFQGIGANAAGIVVHIQPNGTAVNKSLPVGNLFLSRIAHTFGAANGDIDGATMSIGQWIYGNTLDGIKPGMPVEGHAAEEGAALS